MYRCIFWILLIASAKAAYGAKTPSDLQKQLFENYNPKVLPLAKAGDRIPVKVSLNPVYLREIDEEREVLIMDTWIFMKWFDNNLRWDPSSFDGIKSLNVPSTDVWKPDISIYNSSPDKRLLPVIMTNVIIYPNGSVLWVPPVTIHASCPMAENNDPFDVVKCIVKIGSWTYGSLSFDMSAESDKVDLQYLGHGNAMWDLESATVFQDNKYYDCCPDEYYTTLDYSFSFKRQNSNIGIADAVSCFAVLLSLLMFWMDPSTSHKILLGSIAEFLLAIVALYLGVETPAARMRAGQHVIPKMYAVGVFLILEVFIINIAKTGTTYKAPEWLSLAAKGVCQPFQMCMSRMGPSADAENKPENKSDEEGSKDHWKLIAMALDRATFFVSIVILVLMYNVL